MGNRLGKKGKKSTKTGQTSDLNLETEEVEIKRKKTVESSGTPSPPSSDNGGVVVERPHQELRYVPSPVAYQPAGRVVVALYNHQSEEDNALTFVKGDTFEVIDDSDEDWWWACHMETHERGFIASTYVVSTQSLEKQDWFFGDINRIEAEKLLMNNDELANGTFIVRKSESRKKKISIEYPKHVYSLSIKYLNKNEFIYLHHHRIHQNKNATMFIYIENIFPDIADLIRFYQEATTGNIRLSTACPKPLPQTPAPNFGDQWEIDRASLELTKQLGQGNYGEVWHGLWNKHHEVAVKTLKEDSMTVEAFLEEATIMKKLRNPNILMLYAVCTAEQPILIVTEFMNMGSLLEVLRGSRTDLGVDELIELTAQIASGMEYIEDRGLIHRDLAARNILLDSEKQCKIADFGLARAVDGGIYAPNPSTSFPIRWTAPEVIQGNDYSIKSDVWSFAILVMEIFNFGETPYKGIPNQEVSRKVPTGLRMNKPAQCPDNMYELVNKCWNADPEYRPLFAHISSYLADFAVSSEESYADPDECFNE